MGIALALFPNKNPTWVCIGLAFLGGTLLFGAAQLRWIRDAETTFIKSTRSVVAVLIVCGAVVVYGFVVWPPHRRHALSRADQIAFEAPLKSKPDTTISIQMACPTNDEIDCVYASKLIPLFGESGWNISLDVTRVSLPRPMEGINLVLHSTTDYVPKKWNEGVWTKMLPAIVPIDKAFVAIGIEPDSNSGFSVDENQIIVYVGPEKEDESEPTQLTRTVASMEKTEEDRKKGLIKTPGEK